MPEGDTIHRAATALRVALVGKPIVRFDAVRLVGPRPGVGRRIESVESHGKHLEMTFDDGIVLHTHMRMTGSWHLYRPGERWRKSAFQTRVSIEVADWVAVCFNAPVVETFRVADRRRHPGLGRLGPDLCRADADLEYCADLMHAYGEGDTIVADVLLDQRVACGVGNVYKSETLFACRLSPFAEVGGLGRERCGELIETAARLLRENLHRPTRVTDAQSPDGLAVYGRAAKPCLVCHTPIRSAAVGEHRRVTYWCPRCQADGDRRSVERDDTRSWSPSARAAHVAADPHPAAVRFLDDIRAATPSAARTADRSRRR